METGGYPTLSEIPEKAAVADECQQDEAFINVPIQEPLARTRSAPPTVIIDSCTCCGGRGMIEGLRGACPLCDGLGVQDMDAADCTSSLVPEAPKLLRYTTAPAQACFASVLSLHKQVHLEHAAIVLQRWTRGFLIRLKGAKVGEDKLNQMRAIHMKQEARAINEFVLNERHLPANRALLLGLDSQGGMGMGVRAKVLDRILELKYRKQQIVGLDRVKVFLTGLCQDVVARYTFGEQVRVPPILLKGRPGCGKRLAGKLIYEELSALNVCDELSALYDRVALKSGQDIVVGTSFRATSIESQKAVNLLANQIGKVDSVDFDGNAIISFNEPAQKLCVVKSDWSKIQVVKNPTDLSVGQRIVVLHAFKSSCVVPVELQRGQVGTVSGLSTSGNGDAKVTFSRSNERKIAKRDFHKLHLIDVDEKFMEVRNEEDMRMAFAMKQGLGPISSCLYFSDLPLKRHDRVNSFLKELVQALPRAALIFGLNDATSMQQIAGFFSNDEVVQLDLPPYSIEELAEITKRALEKRGYRFSDGLTTQMLVDVFAEQWNESEIAARSGHLVNIMVERALYNKHQRQPVKIGFSADPTLLIPADFGISELNKAELQKKREEAARELSSMPGFEEAKRFVEDLRRRVEYVNAGHGSKKLLDTCMNVVLTGNPGTGKTTFARHMFRTLRVHGVLKKDVFIEKNVLELKGQFQGQTAPTVRDAVRSARGGCLFLDEAYALVPDTGSMSSFSQEAVRMLLTEIENHRTEVLVILAGYKDKMNRLLVQDPGLARRFPMRINLPDYTADQLALIAEKVAVDRFDCKFEDGLVRKLERYIMENHAADIPEQNASLAIGLVEQALERMTSRLIAANTLDSAGTRFLLASDFLISGDAEEKAAEERAQLDREINALVGMQEQKDYLRKLQNQAEFVRRGGTPKFLEVCMNVVLTGNPGTGKTTFARLMFKTLYAHGVLKKNVFVERNALAMKGEYCGQTAPKIIETFTMARGGCLFLDEAYALANGDKFSSEAIRVLLTEVENHRTDVLVVLAGYQDRMDEFFNADPGLRRRFPTILNLKDYSPQELAAIARQAAETRFDVLFDDGLEEQLALWIDRNMSRHDISKHNGGLAVNLTEKALARFAERVIGQGLDPKDNQVQIKLTAVDFDIVESCQGGQDDLSDDLYR